MTVFWSGLSVGAIYSLLALTYGLTLTSSGTFNFAQAQLVMVGAFAAFVFNNEMALSPVVTIVLSALIGVVIGLVEEFLLLRLLGSRRQEAALVTTVGGAVALDGIALLIWGVQPRSVSFLSNSKSLHWLGGYLQVADVAIFAVTVVVAFALHLVTTRTRVGLAIRATASDPEAAQLRGINTRFVGAASFVVAGLILGGVGILVCSKLLATYNMGDGLVVYGFVALALGGFQSYQRILLGGLAAGVVQEVCARYFDANASNLILFGILIVLLMVRPAGFLSVAKTREV